MKRLLLVLVVVLACTFAVTASAAKVPPLSLNTETISNSPNPAAPIWCMNEDDYDQRFFYGYLFGSYTTQFQLCDRNVDGWDAGGEGVFASVAAVGTLSDLTITSPGGVVRHAELTGTTKNRGVTTNTYKVCVCPPFSLSTDTGTDPLAGDVWNVTLSGQMSSVQWDATVQMAYVSAQQQGCPLDQQNLTP